MDLDLKQWRAEVEAQPTTTPSSNNNKHHHLPSSASTLPLFFSEPSRQLSAFPSDHSSSIPSRSRMESYFSSSQWQELELQALIFRHMSAGADVPAELLHLVKKSLITSPFYHYYPHFHPSLVQSGYWGRAAAMDPEPGRCRRTDGKKWRCSRDVVAAQKYCERHMHRGKNRSRKHVEAPTSATSPYGGEPFKPTNSLTRPAAGGPSHFTLSAPSHSSDLLHLNQSDASRPAPRPTMRTEDPFHARNNGHHRDRTTLHFFDDWPKPLGAGSAATSAPSPTNLSISMPGNNPSSDFSLKLGTGDRGEASSDQRDNKPQLNWGATWENNPVAPMGGPLAEALRSSATSSHLSPTTILHRLPCVPTSEATY